MRHAKVLTALTLLVTSIAVSGCVAGPKAPTADLAPKKQAHLDDPAGLFDNARLSSKILTVDAMAYTGCSPKKKAKRKARGAWGDPLTGDVKAVAVSPDLLNMGLDHGDVIRIEGLPGEYKVLDIMNSRHSKTIDIFYGDDQCGAREWGRRTLTITWQ